MLKLIFSKFVKNSRLYSGTFLTICLVSMIIGACLHLISGCITSSDDGHRFNACQTVVSASEKVTYFYQDGDEIKDETEILSQERVFTPNELETFLNLIGNEEYVFDYTFPVCMQRHAGALYGHNYSAVKLSGFTLTDGTAPRNNEIAIDENFAEKYSVKVGDILKIQTGSEKQSFTVSGIVGCSVGGMYALQNFLFFNDETAQTLSHGVYNIGLFAENEILTEKLQGAGFDVYIEKDVNKAEFSFLKLDFFSPMIVFITMGSICLLASIFVLFGTISFSVRHRQREIALLRTLGLSRKQLFGMLVLENLLIGCLGLMAGLLLSLPFAFLIRSLFLNIGILSAVYQISPNALMISLLCAGVIALPIMVSLGISGKTISVSPMQAMKEEEIKTKKKPLAKFIFGLILFGGALAVIFATPYYSGLGVGMGFCAVGLFLGASFLFTPAFMKLINALLGFFTRQMHQSLGSVAKANVKEKANKFAIAAISLALMFALNSVMLLNNFTYIADNAQNRYDLFKDANYYLTDYRNDINLTDYVSMTVRNTNLLFCGGNHLYETPAIAVENDNLLSLDIYEGRFIENADEVIIMNNYAGLNVGDTVETYLPDGTQAELLVVGKYRYKYDFIFESGIPNAIIMYETLQNCLFDTVADRVYLNKTQQKELATLAETYAYSLTENNREAYLQNEEFDVQKAAIVLMIVISVFLTLVALFNTFAMIMNVRTKEFNCLRLIGANKAQIWKMTAIETAIVTFTGMLLGFLFSTICVGYFSYRSFGVFDFIVNPAWYFGLFAAITCCGLLAGFIPSFRTVIKLKQTYRQD